MALDGVGAVGFAVPDVVQKVERRRDAAEGDRGSERPKRRPGLCRRLAEEKRRDDEEILRPLGGAEGAKESLQRPVLAQGGT